MRNQFRCTCPITSALDVLGDKWTLVIAKQMLIEHKKTFKDFIESDESIATNILSTRLKTMEESGLLSKTKMPENKKTNVYLLTKKGMDLAAIIIDLGSWSETHLSKLNPRLIPHPQAELIRTQREQVIEYVKQVYQEKIIEASSK